MIDKTLLEDKKIDAPDTIVDAIDSFNLQKNIVMFSNKYSIPQTDADTLQTTLEAYIYGLIDQNGLHTEINTMPNSAQLMASVQNEIIQPFLISWKKIKDEDEEINAIINRKDDLVLESDTPGFLDILQNTYTEDADKITDTEHQTLQKAGIVIDGAPAVEQTDSSLDFVKMGFSQPTAKLNTNSNHVIPNITKPEPTTTGKTIPKPPKKDLYHEAISD